MMLSKQTKIENAEAASELRLEVKPFQGDMRRAFSCLVEPRLGDTVLVAVHPEGPLVLAILARAGLGDATLSLPDPAASLTLHAQTVSIDAVTRVDITAPDIGLKSRVLYVLADAFSVMAKLAVFAGDRFRSLARDQMTSADRVVLQARERVTTIDDIDVQKARVQVSQADLTSARAQTAVVQARDDLRFDGKRVLIG